MSDPAKPVVSAFLCERVLTESDGVQSYIRVIDTLIGRTAKGERARFQVWLVVILRSTDEPGEYTLRVRLTAPEGQASLLGEAIPIALKGGEHSAVLNLVLVLEPDNEGLYRIDLLLDNEWMARVPVRVRLERTPPEPSSSTESKQGSAERR